MLWNTVLAPIVRHGLGFVAGGLIASGYVDAEQAATVTGALMGLAAVGWSVIEKRRGWAK